MPSKASAKIRMYRLNELGDCFLVTLTAGRTRSHLLVDCGSFRNSNDSIDRLRAIMEQIKTDLGGSHVHVAVGTHQHNDHLSGFLHCAEEFKQLGVGEVWLSWLDDPKDKTAQAIGKAHNNLRKGLNVALQKMTESPSPRRPDLNRSIAVVDDMLGFFGASKKGKAPPDVPARAVEVLKKLGKKKPKYLEPGEVIDMPGLPKNAVRIHVLGPPRAHDALYRKDPKTGESYDHALASATCMAAALFRALDRTDLANKVEEDQYPFDAEHKRPNGGSLELATMQARYRTTDQAWRSIDDDWMKQAESLALFLNDYTNNSSLVLAIELVESGKVLLFAADAQTGNWASWKDIKWADGHPGTRDLLQRTVFYKVGHHASHNATLVEAFEEMGGDDLCALIPVHKQDPNITKKNGWKMPAKALFKRLKERTGGRVLQMDNVNPTECDPAEPSAKAAWKRVGVKPNVTELAIELEIK
jgi:hypothetical protein